MTAALGGEVQLNPRGREIGIARNICPTDAGRQHAMFADKAGAFDAICVHEDEVAELPACGTLLASNAMSRVQAAVMCEGDAASGVCITRVRLATVAAIIAMRTSRHISEVRRAEDEPAGVPDYQRSALIRSVPIRLKHGASTPTPRPARTSNSATGWTQRSCRSRRSVTLRDPANSLTRARRHRSRHVPPARCSTPDH